MFQTDVETLTKMGAQITTAEIKQQPELWRVSLPGRRLPCKGKKEKGAGALL